VSSLVKMASTLWTRSCAERRRLREDGGHPNPEFYFTTVQSRYFDFLFLRKIKIGRKLQYGLM
jgi:hypothetical protein